MRKLYGILFASLIVCVAWGSDKPKTQSDDPYKKYRSNQYEIPLLTQEIIKFRLKKDGIQFFDAQQKNAEERAAAHNKAGTENCDADGEYGFAWAVPSWGLTTTFYAVQKESDPLTNMVYEAVNKNRHGDQRTAYRPQFTKHDDGSIECYIRMAGYPYMWAKEYSQKNQL